MWPFNRKKKDKGGTTVGENVCVLTIQVEPDAPKKKTFKDLKKAFPFLTKEDFKEIEAVFSSSLTTRYFIMTSPKIQYEGNNLIGRAFRIEGVWGEDSCDCGDTWSSCCGGPNFSAQVSHQIRMTPRDVLSLMGTIFPPSLQKGRNIKELTLSRVWRGGSPRIIPYELSKEDVDFFMEAREKRQSASREKPNTLSATLDDMFGDEFDDEED